MRVTTAEQKRKEGGFAETVRVVIHALIIAVVIRTFLFQPFNIPSGSMMATLLIGDYLFVSKYTYGYSRYSFPFSPPLFSGRIFGSGPERGDVVVFRLPTDDSTDYIKRVIGLPGDRVEVRQKRVFVNDRPLQEPYAHYADGPPGSGAARSEDVREAYGPVTVPDGQYFMMGDNRDNSQDSRFWGYLPHHYLKGQALFIYFSFAEAGSLSRFFSDVRWGRIGGRVR
jgi:signal peptidase I